MERRRLQMVREHEETRDPAARTALAVEWATLDWLAREAERKG